MSALERRWTAAEVRELQDEERSWPRYELIDGELLVTPGPRPIHQLAVGYLYRRLAAYVEHQHLGTTLTGPADLELEPESVTQPDIFVVPARYAYENGPLVTWAQVEGLLLAVEVISPSSVKADRLTKRVFFQRVGVPDYWIVDVDARTFEQWRPTDAAPDVLRTSLQWLPTGATEPFVLDLGDFFDRIRSGKI